MRTLLRHALVPLLLLAAAACSTSFPPFRFIEKPRVVGATISVTADPARYTPAPGEAARLTLLTADPGKRQGRTYFLVVCVPGATGADIVACDETSVVAGLNSVDVLPGDTDPKPEPFVDFTVPDEATLGEAEELWLFGAVCNGGTVRNLLTDPPVRGEAFDPCMDDPTAMPPPNGQLITTRIRLQREANDTNYTPGLATLTLDGIPVATYESGNDDVESTGCAQNPAFAQIVADGQQHDFVATATPASFESYVHFSETDARAEDLYFRLYFTAGGTNNEYDYIDASHTEATLKYTPPSAENVDPSGLFVRFYGQIADERYAVDPFQFAFCVVPPP